MLVLAKTWGEVFSLNQAARDYTLSLAKKENGRLPLGDPLPYPHYNKLENEKNATVAMLEDAKNNNHGIEWLAPHQETVNNGS
jgi:hypothetical protein